MKKAGLVVAFLSIFLVLTSPAGAVITDWNCAADGDGAIVMAGTPGWQDTGLNEDDIATYTMTMDGAQYSGPAHVLGDFITDTETDPIVWIMEDVDNATGFTWTGYEFEVFMSKPFTITGVTAPMGWTYAVSPILSGQPLPVGVGTGWMGVVTYTANPGYEIVNGDTGTFGVRVKFDGTVAFCTQQTPIPEPMTIAMLGLGGLLLKRKK